MVANRRAAALGARGGPANTVASSHGWELKAVDRLHSRVALASGMAAALGGGSTPVPAAEKAEGANSSGVIGVVYRRFVAEQDLETIQHDGDLVRRSAGRTRSTDGPVAPGDYMLIVVMGPAQVRVDGAAGSVQAGDLLSTASVSGAAAAAQQVEAGGVAFYAPGTTIGKALEPLAKDDDGLIWAMITLQ